MYKILDLKRVFFSLRHLYFPFVLTALLDKGSLDFHMSEFNSFLSGQVVKLSFSFKMSGVYIFHGKLGHAMSDFKHRHW